jgi:glycosyltransferase involved in cell wall biosynthesis
MQQAVAAVIPALNEERTIGEAVTSLREQGVSPVVVADNGSNDGTASVARAAGAWVVTEMRRGYGRACLTALAALAPQPPRAVLFMDGDLSDVADEAPLLYTPVLEDRADLVIGSRVLGMRQGRVEPGALTTPQRFGNALSCTLLKGLYGVDATDLGPFRAVGWEALARLRMEDEDFGWTVEMQVKAARLGLRVVEVPVAYRRRRAGKSKVSGDVKGSVKAGLKILYTVARHARGGHTKVGA